MPLRKPLLDTLDRMGFGGVLLDENGRVSDLNRAAKRLAKKVSFQCDRNDNRDWENAVRALLKHCDLSAKQEAWSVLPDAVSDGHRPLIVHWVPIEDARAGNRTVVVIVDLNASFEPSPETLQKIFRLSPAETKLCIELVNGKTLEEIAEQAGVSVGTVRKQLASIYAKTDTHRQPELTALLARVAILP